MRIQQEDFPLVVQAYDPAGANDAFIAEQVVYTQSEIDHFTSRYAGMLIKARDFSEMESSQRPDKVTHARRRSGSALGWILFALVVIIGLLVWGFATGWIQKTFGIYPPV